MVKKNFRNIPERIRTKVDQIQDDNLVVSCLLKFTDEQLRTGYLNHLNITLDENGIHLPDSIIPNETQGKHSFRNVNGQVIVRDDLPKEIKYFTWEVPNWGDYSNGTHDIDVPREVYRRDFISPHFASILIECRNSTAGLSSYNILFQIDEVLNKKSDNFEDRLFELINILQENVFHCDVNAATSTYNDYLSTIHLDWEILPPGQRELIISKVMGSSNDPVKRRIITERYDFLMSLNPRNIIHGTSGLQRYFGAEISDNLVVFENIQYGNAIYVMYDNWETLSQRSRTELLSGVFGNNFDRILHLDGWEDKIRSILNTRMTPSLI